MPHTGDHNNESLEKILNVFIEASIKHNAAIMQGDWKTANLQAKRIHKSFLEIINIGRYGREALLKFVDHTDPSVAAMAATYSLKYNAEKSLSVLRKISKDPGLIGLRAGQSIKNWESGTWELE